MVETIGWYIKEEQAERILASRDNTKVKHIEKTASKQGLQDIKRPLIDSYINPTEGNEQTTMLTQNNISPRFLGLYTVPVILKNGERSLKISALLDEASTNSYVKVDVAAKLGLHGRTEKMTVNVLNGQVETFKTSPINVELTSITGTISARIKACTVDRVMGNMPVIEWNKCRNQWDNLRNIDFPTAAPRPIVDMLLGLDCVDLIYAIQEVRGKPGEPIARLTPLGWTCIGSI